MQTVQLAVGDAPYGAVLHDLLEHAGTCRVTPVNRPDPRQDGVLVVDEAGLESLPVPLIHPERVVLITRNDPRLLARAWDAGIRCVVFDTDPPRTMVLAVMAAALRVRCPSVPDSPVHMTQHHLQTVSKAKENKLI
jgi:hypothetical protein